MKRVALLLAVSVGLFSSCNKDPEVSFTSDLATVVAGESVTFTNGSSDKTYNPSWSFGDGASATTWNASHVYQEEGTYVVTLSGTAKKGNKTASVTNSIVVTGRPGDGVAKEITNLMVGSWSLSKVGMSFAPCITGSTAYTGNGNADALKYKFNIISEGTGSYTNQNSVENSFWINLLDETTANISSFSAPMTVTGGGVTSTVNTPIPSGIYKITLSASAFTFTRTEDRYRGGSNDCYDMTTYSFTLSK